MSAESPPLLRPRPRRPFELTPLSSAADSSPDGRSSPEPPSASGDDAGNPPSRTRSLMNLTASTLFGIYSPAGYAPDRDETPWGTGAQTPIDSKGISMADLDGGNVDDALLMRSKKRRGSMLQASTHRSRQHKRPQKKGFKNYVLPMVGKSAVLGAAGILYGQLISHLHSRQTLVPVQVEGMPSGSWAYIGYWCFSGIALGQALPWVDSIWDGDADGDEVEREYVRSARDTQNTSRNHQTWTPGWNEIVRFIGAAVGIIFAIRRLPWQSPLQLSLTLALANPAIWYLLDRTGPCFILSTTVALSGTAILLSINPDLIPSPTVHSFPPHILSSVTNGTAASSASSLPHQELVAGMFTHESVGVATWIASVLFVSCVCFGNIGRRL